MTEGFTEGNVRTLSTIPVRVYLGLLVATCVGCAGASTRFMRQLAADPRAACVRAIRHTESFKDVQEDDVPVVIPFRQGGAACVVVKRPESGRGIAGSALVILDPMGKIQRVYDDFGYDPAAPEMGGLMAADLTGDGQDELIFSTSSRRFDWEAGRFVGHETLWIVAPRRDRTLELKDVAYDYAFCAPSGEREGFGVMPAILKMSGHLPRVVLIQKSSRRERAGEIVLQLRWDLETKHIQGEAFTSSAVSRSATTRPRGVSSKPSAQPPEGHTLDRPASRPSAD